MNVSTPVCPPPSPPNPLGVMSFFFLRSLLAISAKPLAFFLSPLYPPPRRRRPPPLKTKPAHALLNTRVQKYDPSPSRGRNHTALWTYFWLFVLGTFLLMGMIATGQVERFRGERAEAERQHDEDEAKAMAA